MAITSTIICGGCGTHNLSDSIFCEECGVAIGVKTEELRNPPFPTIDLRKGFDRGKSKPLKKSSKKEIQARIDARVKVIKQEIEERKILETPKKKRNSKKLKKMMQEHFEDMRKDPHHIPIVAIPKDDRVKLYPRQETPIDPTTVNTKTKLADSKIKSEAITKFINQLQKDPILQKELGLEKAELTEEGFKDMSIEKRMQIIADFSRKTLSNPDFDYEGAKSEFQENNRLLLDDKGNIPLEEECKHDFRQLHDNDSLFGCVDCGEIEVNEFVYPLSNHYREWKDSQETSTTINDLIESHYGKECKHGGYPIFNGQNCCRVIKDTMKLIERLEGDYPWLLYYDMIVLQTEEGSKW